MGRLSRRGGQGDRGAVIVEFAFVLPVLVCLMLGIITGGHALARKNNLTDAAREGARFAATLDGGTSAVPADRQLWVDKVKARIRALDPRLTDGDICVALVAGSATSDTTCGVSTPPNSSGTQIVKVRTQGTERLQAFFFSMNLPLNAGVAVRYERVEV